MKVILCLDENCGMMFNQRRQSRDRRLTERILQICAGRKLWMNSYSRKLFTDVKAENIFTDEKFLQKASDGEYCFVESERLQAYEDKIERLIVFWWNKRYPADFHLDLSLHDWEKISSEDLKGFSHDKITEEIYRKKHD